MKKKMLFLLVTSITILISACSSNNQDLQNESGRQGNPVQERLVDNQNQGSNGNQGNGPAEAVQHEISFVRSDGELSSAELEGIVFMMEEEKLARDVYLMQADMWNMSIFANIARSENIHMDAISGLMDLFEIDDPSAGAGVGEFRNLELQSLYDDLVDKGSQSLVDAILVGGAIEEIDILDLQSYLDETSDGKIVQVYQNLLQGSINHLASFARTYERQTGDDYQPQYLSQEDYENLINQGSIAGNSQRGQRMKAGSQGNGMSW